MHADVFLTKEWLTPGGGQDYYSIVYLHACSTLYYNIIIIMYALYVYTSSADQYIAI